jgi:hypothetical protein
VTNLEGSSEHLFLVNSVLSLSYNLESYPNLLHKAGYKIVSIEPQFKINGSANPDLIFMSEENVLIAECKGGEYYIGTNLPRYEEIDVQHLVEKGIDIPSREIQIDVGVFGGNNFEILIQRLKENGITYPQVKIDTVIQKISGDDFKDSELIGLFSDAVRIEGKPLHIIKFSTNSLHEDIAPYIIQALMARSIKGSPSFTTRDLTREIFEDIWDSFDTKYQTSLCKKVGAILKMAKNNQLNTYLKKSGET